MTPTDRQTSSRFARFSLFTIAGSVFLMLYLPIVTLIAFSFTASRFPFFPVRAWSTRWYEQLAQDELFFTALTNSLLVSGAAALTATVLGFLGAYALVRAQFPGKEAFSTLLVFPLAIPLLLLALGLRIYFVAVGIKFGLFAVFLGHLVYMIPLSVLVLRGRFARFPWSLEEAALDLGASRVRVVVEILLPWMMPAIVGSLLLTFTFSFDEFIIAWFLTTFDVTLPIKIWTDLLMTYNPKVNVIGTIVFLLSVSTALLAQWALRKR